jgi:predicted porin
MKTKLLRLAVLGVLAVPAAALAQGANVTLYGRVNLDLEYTKVSGQPTVYKLVNDSSRFGLRGTEELGGGLKAIFQLENSVNWDSSGGTIAGRESFVGLAGSMGKVQIGRKLDPLYEATWDSGPEPNHDTGNASDALFGGANNGGQPAFAYGGVFTPNAVYYQSPTMQGFTVELEYSALSESATPTRVGFEEVTFNYDNGPLHVGTGYGYSKTANAATTNKAQYDKAWPVVAVYDFDKAIVAAGYERAWLERPGSATATRNYWRVWGKVPYGPNEFHLGYGHAGSVSTQSSSGAGQWLAGYNYNLSQRTKLYAIYTRVNNDTNGRYGFLSSTPGVNNTGFGVGMRMNF